MDFIFAITWAVIGIVAFRNEIYNFAAIDFTIAYILMQRSRGK